MKRKTSGTRTESKTLKPKPIASVQIRPLVAQAAAVKGVSVLKFVTDAALKEATQVIEQERLIQLTEADAVLIQRLLDDPPKPNAKMMKAIDAHRELIDG